jgi:hypothetical protein
MFSSADLSLAAGKMRKNLHVTGDSGMILHNHTRLSASILSVKIAALGCLKRLLEGFTKLINNVKGGSKKL